VRDGSLVVLEGDAMSIAFDATRPLRGSGIVVVRGDVTLSPGSTSYYSGLLYVEGNLTMDAPASIRGAVIVTGSVTVQGVGDFADITYDDKIIEELRKTLANYRISRAAQTQRRDGAVDRGRARGAGHGEPAAHAGGEGLLEAGHEGALGRVEGAAADRLRHQLDLLGSQGATRVVAIAGQGGTGCGLISGRGRRALGVAAVRQELLERGHGRRVGAIGCGCDHDADAVPGHAAGGQPAGVVGAACDQHVRGHEPERHGHDE
jgi:hypothetical protein